MVRSAIGHRFSILGRAAHHLREYGVSRGSPAIVETPERAKFLSGLREVDLRAAGAYPVAFSMTPTESILERQIIQASRAFAGENRRRSWSYVLSTFSLLAASGWAAFRAPWWPARAAASLVEGLLLVRGFVLFHDHFHGALLRGSAAARVLFSAYGYVVMTPPRVWKETHNYHHAHNGKIVGSHVGAYPIVTLAMWSRMASRERLAYRATRHPLTIGLGYFTIFAWGMCAAPFLRAPRKNASCLAALSLQPLLGWAVVQAYGWTGYLSAVLCPLVLAMATGAYLFYAQHSFRGAQFQPRESWSYVRAALESSSYMPMGPVMRFFTGNIGYHHVHHLNPSIPFYRLPEAMEAVPALRAPKTTRWCLRDVVDGFRAAIWDPTRGRMISFAEAREALAGHCGDAERARRGAERGRARAARVVRGRLRAYTLGRPRGDGGLGGGRLRRQRRARGRALS